MTDPFISVIVPAYNSASTIVEALDSILSQSWLSLEPSRCRQLEILVIDDASSDQTRSIVDTWVAHLPPELHGRLISHSSNRGPAAARNAGITNARGEWIAFLDADDAWLPRKLEVQTSLLKKHPHVALWCGRRIPFDGLVEETTDPPYGWNPLPLEAFAEGNPVATSTVMAKLKQVIRTGGFDEQFRGPEDYDLWMRIVAHAPAGVIDVPLSRYRKTIGSLSMDDRKFLPQVMAVCAKAYGRDGVFANKSGYRCALAYQHLSASWMASQRQDMKAAYCHYARAQCLWLGSFPWKLQFVKRSIRLFGYLMRHRNLSPSNVL